MRTNAEGVREYLLTHALHEHLLHPVGDHVERLLALGRVVRLEMHAEEVFASHAAVHHELHRECRRLAGIECHRTDDRVGRSAALHDFDVRGLRDLQGLVAGITEHERGLGRVAQLDVAEIDHLVVGF